MKSTGTQRLTLGLVVSGLLTGCGGGGGGGSTASSSSAPTTANTNTVTPTQTPSTPQTATVSGIVENAGGSGISGDRVAYDASVLTSAVFSATTDSTGHFSIAVPIADITGSDTLSVYDSLGAVAWTQTVTPVPGQIAMVTIMLANAAPPPPAPLSRSN